MKNCPLCFTEFISENVGRCSPQLLDLCNKYLHSSLTHETIFNQASRSLSFCSKCFQSAADLVHLNNQMTFYQKRISELVLTISLDILYRRGKSANVNSCRKKLIEFDVSALPNSDSWDISTSYYQQTTAPSKEFHNTPSEDNYTSSAKQFYTVISENNYSYPEELCDPLLTTPASAPADCENAFNIKVEHSSTQNIEEQFDGNETSSDIYIESVHSNSMDYNENSGNRAEDLESPEIILMPSETTTTNSVPGLTSTNISEIGWKKRKRATKTPAEKREKFPRNYPRKPLECPVCHKVLSSPNHMKEHMRIHTGERPYECSVCKKSFTTKPNLLVHERIHTGEKPFYCHLCDKRYSSESNMIHHNKRCHSGNIEKPFKCDLCDFSAFARSNVEKHKSKKHPTFW